MSTDTYSPETQMHMLTTLMNTNPVVKNCLNIVNGTCLAQGIVVTIKGKQASREFKVSTYLPIVM